MSSDMSADMIRRLRADDERLRQTETKEVPGGIPGFTSFYAIGTWTPTLVGLTIPGTFTYGGTTAGTWTRIGNTVLLRGRITIAVVTTPPTGNLTIGGLPIAATTVTGGVAGGLAFIFWSLVNINSTGAETYLSGLIGSAASRADLVVSRSNGAAGVTLTGVVANISANTDLWFTGQYQV